MIRVRVDAGATGEVIVQAESIGQALNIAGGVFPGSELRVSFPLDPESFFVQDGSVAGVVEPDVFEREAG